MEIVVEEITKNEEEEEKEICEAIQTLKIDIWLVIIGIIHGFSRINNSNSSSLCLFHAIWLDGERVLHVDKFQEQESWNSFPSASS